jgi:hypothetical protein
MVTLQDLIHYLEVGSGMKFFNRTMRTIVCVLGVLFLLVAYDLRAYRNLSTQEAMDSVQLARNLAQGNGYTTLFVRPLSIFLLQNQYRATHEGAQPSRAADPALLKGNHPDLANPPVYPLLLAGLMKTLPFNYAISKKPSFFWSKEGKFYRYQPDFLIALFNQALFLCVVVLSFFLARRLFDPSVAWLSSILLIGSELFWRFSVSGLPTILMLLIFMGLIWCLVLLDAETREPKESGIRALLLTVALGVLVGLGGLTRYSFAMLILPVLGYVILCTGKRRAMLAVTLVAAFLVVLTPWVVRNYSLSGMPFGTATFAIIENSAVSPDDRLERSLNPEILRPARNSFPFLSAAAHVFWQKLVADGRNIVQSDLPKLGGTWVSGFFLVGLLVRFNQPVLGRLRLFLLASLVVLMATQSLGRTKLSDDSPDINSENIIILVAPLVLIYGVSLFFVVLDQVKLPLFQIRSAAIGLFSLVACLPLILAILPPKTSPIVYPPYYPPSIQTSVGWVKEDELIMSDIPAAVAWYGQSQCVSLSISARTDFFAINDFLRPISALYLTPQTVDRWTQAGDWGNLFLQTIRVLPGDTSKYPLHLGLGLPQRDGPNIPFPLDYLQAGWPMQLLFTYRQHWAPNYP